MLESAPVSSSTDGARIEMTVFFQIFELSKSHLYILFKNVTLYIIFLKYVFMYKCVCGRERPTVCQIVHWDVWNEKCGSVGTLWRSQEMAGCPPPIPAVHHRSSAPRLLMLFNLFLSRAMVSQGHEQYSKQMWNCISSHTNIRCNISPRHKAKQNQSLSGWGGFFGQTIVL